MGLTAASSPAGRPLAWNGLGVGAGLLVVDDVAAFGAGLSEPLQPARASARATTLAPAARRRRRVEGADRVGRIPTPYEMPRGRRRHHAVEATTRRYAVCPGTCEGPGACAPGPS